MSDKGWDDAMNGCTYVLHVASPFVFAEPKDEQEMIKPAVEGTLRVVKAAQKAGVRRMVLTSSTFAMIAGKETTRCVTRCPRTRPPLSVLLRYG